MRKNKLQFAKDAETFGKRVNNAGKKFNQVLIEIITHKLDFQTLISTEK